MRIVFYGTDGNAGKARTAQLRNEKVQCRLLHAEACFDRQKADEIEFMPDVSAPERERLNALFGKPADATPASPGSGSNPRGLKVGLGPGGRIYIREGRNIHSGPYDTQADADAALALELVK